MHLSLGDSVYGYCTLTGFDSNWVSVFNNTTKKTGSMSTSFITAKPGIVESRSTPSLREYIQDRFVLAGTGSRSYDPLVNTQTHARLEYVLEKTREKHPDLVVMSGGAEGWDYWLAKMAEVLEIPYVLCIPNSGYGRYYYKPGQHKAGEAAYEQWATLLVQSQAIELTTEVHGLDPHSLNLNGLHMNFVRNERMVELASGFVVFDAESRGTRHCVDLLRKVNKTYMVL